MVNGGTFNYCCVCRVTLHLHSFNGLCKVILYYNFKTLLSDFDVHFLGANDPQNKTEYPMVRCVSTQVPRYCCNCHTNIASWVCNRYISDLCPH